MESGSSSSSKEYDVIVLGAGVEGSSTAYNLTKNGGGRVLLLEQFSALHTRGSSHGGSRITRRAYTKAYYIKMMDEAYRMWDQIEREGKTQLYLDTGLLMFGPKSSHCLQDAIRCLAESGTPHNRLSAQQVMSKYPSQLYLPFNHEGVFEKDGGLLMATKAVATLQRLFIENGGEFLDGHKVKEITPGPIIRVTTDQGVFTARRLIITAGAWAPAIMATLGVHLPFKVCRTEVLYWKAEEPKDFSWENFPAFICYTDSEDPYYHVYGLPIYEYPGLVKICFHTNHNEVDPDARDALPGPSTTDLVRPFVQRHFKGVQTTPSIYEACMYTESPDEDPVLDRHPLYPNIIMGAGFSGHGFKLAPVVGKILTELALDLPSSYDLAPFRLDRFTWQSPAKL
ncbi:peroxisomal sarcosine oxidase-like isoform X1 [Halichondria panicea]|uniref:peroxisomal sarcosine oxidase-like isoform X1 n=1 Tax=Halichondria panicea TaxID=6063 RepID=UPI00312B9823